MERRFSMNDFEHSLKEHADDFKMIPSKSVWHGIYNDMHPGRRWPSITVSLLLIFMLVVVGHLNTHNGSKAVNSKNYILPPNTTAGNFRSAEHSNTEKISHTEKITAKVDVNNSVKLQDEGITAQAQQSNNFNTGKVNNKNESLIPVNPLAQNSNATVPSESAEIGGNNIAFPKAEANPDNIVKNVFDYSNVQLQNTRNGDDNRVKSGGIIREKIAVNIQHDLQSDGQISLRNANLIYPNVVHDYSNTETANQKDNGKVAKELRQKRNDKMSWVYFVAPVVNSVSFSGQPIKPLNNNNSPAVAINSGNYQILHNSALGFEAGVQINNSLTGKLWLTSGVHISYSGYNIISNEVHPTFANLLLKDPATGDVYSKSYITHYGNGTGQTAASIRNYSLQASLPIGLQYQFAGSDKIKFDIYANFEPSMVIKSNAYILSSDGDNYINDPDLLRKFNMSSNFGAFITFNSAKFRWQIGPNIRYQWLSTYKRDYTIKEHLIDYGIRISISPFRK